MTHTKHTSRIRTLTQAVPIIAMALAIGACGNNDDDDSAGVINGTSDNIGTAVFASRASFETGQVQRLSISGGDVLDGAYEATGGDIVVATDGTSVYQLGRFLIDNITKYSLDDVTTPIYQRSVAGMEASANPHDIVFVNETKAYLIRYDSPAVWIVDPSADSDELFKTGELDLSAYDVNDATPEPNSAVIIIIVTAGTDSLCNTPRATGCSM